MAITRQFGSKECEVFFASSKGDVLQFRISASKLWINVDDGPAYEIQDQDGINTLHDMLTAVLQR